MREGRVFLAAQWRHLAMLNYAVDPELLRAHVPRGVELDAFDGTTFVSLVGFRFLRTKVLGVGIPLHEDFEEVNLRFYVRRVVDGVARRGVVFVREIVPRRAIAMVARLLFRENYVAAPMSHRIRHECDATPERVSVDYRWRRGRDENRIALTCVGSPLYAAADSLEQFITEHFWGYAARRGGGCLEYEVAHEPWRIWNASDAGFEGDATAYYGSELARVLRRTPDSAFLAEGSAVTVAFGRGIS